MTAPSIPALLEPIQARLDAATPGPWKADNLENTHGHRGIYWVSIDRPDHIMTVAEVDANDDGVEAVWKFDDAVFIAAAPTDTARLLAAVKAVTALPHEDYCCTKGCPGFGLATCGKVHKNGDECDGSECSCFMSGPLRAIEAALRGEA